MQHFHILLKRLNLVVQVYELGCLLLEKQRSVGNIESHQVLLPLVNSLEVVSLVPESLQTICSLLPQLVSIVEEHR